MQSSLYVQAVQALTLIGTTGQLFDTNFLTSKRADKDCPHLTSATVRYHNKQAKKSGNQNAWY